MNTVFEIAAKYNTAVARLKDDEIYKSRHGKELRAAAAAAIDKPIVCTAKEFGERYGNLFSATTNWSRVADNDPEDVFVWCFSTSTSSFDTKRKHIDPMPVGKIQEKMKYNLQKSHDKENWWVLTDTDSQIVCQFKQGDFNGTQKFSPLRDIKDYDVTKLPTIVREMTDWLAKNHREIV